MTIVRLDYETFARTDLRKHGLDRYSADPDARILMAAYKFDSGSIKIAENGGDPLVMPRDLAEALADPNVIKKAFNAGFERIVTHRMAKIKTPYRGWRCTMVRGFMAAFSGGLAEMGGQMGLPADKLKNPRGSALIRMFSMPQKVSKNQPHEVRNARTDPAAWQEFCDYCVQDVVVEESVEDFVRALPVRQEEWDYYELDQRINDRGMPVDLVFAEAAYGAYERFQTVMHKEMAEILGMDEHGNPNSVAQILPWLKAEGYWFDDLRDETIEKVLRENKTEDRVSPEGVRLLKLRQQSSYSSVKKYLAMQRMAGRGNVLRNTFQFGGASRTLRDSGRGVQTQNLVRPPGYLEKPWQVEACVEAIVDGDDDFLRLLVPDVTEAISGLLRSAIAAEEGQEFRICDLSSIETVVIAWISGCKRLLNVFAQGKDPYKDFATELFRVLYDEVSKAQRQQAKPAVLGAGFRLGGGELRNGKRTGMWGYAEGLGVDVTREQAQAMVKLWRTLYPEVVQMWKKFEAAAADAMSRRDQHITCGPVTFIRTGDFMRVRLPSGRHLFYHKPRMEKRTVRTGRFVEYVNEDGETAQREETFETIAFTYLGTNQVTGRWERLEQHGGRWMENLVQAIARDILWEGIARAEKAGFRVIGRVHDEIITLAPTIDETYTVEHLRDLMTAPMPWAPDIRLKAEGVATRRYVK